MNKIKVILALIMVIALLVTPMMVAADRNAIPPEEQTVGIEPTSAVTVNGFVERINARYIQGWAFNPSAPTRRTQAHIYIRRIDDTLLDRRVVTANIFRQDLVSAGAGRDGFQMFRWQWDGGVLYWHGAGQININLRIRVYFVDPQNTANRRLMADTTWHSPYVTTTVGAPGSRILPRGVAERNTAYYIPPATVRDRPEWANAIRRGAGHWNSTDAGVNLVQAAQANTPNRVDAASFTWAELGRYEQFAPNVGRAGWFRILNNTRTIAQNAGTTQAAAANHRIATATVVHEFGHALWLADNPRLANLTVGGERRSIMRYDHIFGLGVYRPQVCDIDAVRSAFQWQNWLLQ